MGAEVLAPVWTPVLVHLQGLKLQREPAARAVLAPQELAPLLGLVLRPPLAASPA